MVCVFVAAAAAAEAAVAAGRGEGALVGQTPSNYVLLKVMCLSNQSFFFFFFFSSLCQPFYNISLKVMLYLRIY